MTPVFFKTVGQSSLTAECRTVSGMMTEVKPNPACFRFYIRPYRRVGLFTDLHYLSHAQFPSISSPHRPCVSSDLQLPQNHAPSRVMSIAVSTIALFWHCDWGCWGCSC
uniref:Uncharacterized protein n=1 Tax=Neogobius melanostomus TaxID=47308 RepID=A0A8C6TXP7_9GOBI